jgi:hypothetical protein
MSSRKNRKKLYENPFNSNPIKEPENFFNREEEMSRILDLLIRSKNGSVRCISIVGERKIGKTSFVNMLLHEEQLRSHGINADDYTLIYMNIAEQWAKSQEQFLEQILQSLTYHGNLDLLPLEKKNDIRGRIVRAVDQVRHKKRILFFLDEFEAIYDIWDKKLAGWLRALSQEHGVGFITVSLKPLSKIQFKDKEKDQISPFYNIFQDFVLGLLDENSSRKMINEVFRRGGIRLRTNEVSFLLEISGGNPFFIQLAGSLYFEERKNKRSEQIDLNSFEKEAFRQSEKHFRQYWKNFDSKERKYIMDVGKGFYDPDSYIEYDLEKRGILRRKKGKISFFSPLFGRFVEECIADNSRLPNTSEFSRPREEESDILGEYNVFICHASEDKEPFVRELAERLAEEGLKVWYDEFTLKLGNSLRRGIDQGISRSHHAIVVLSKNFFAKEWAQKELDALVEIESETRKILPIWHGVTKKEVQSFSPILASRFAISSEGGIDSVVNRVLEFFGKGNPKRKDEFSKRKHKD